MIQQQGNRTSGRTSGSRSWSGRDQRALIDQLARTNVAMLLLTRVAALLRRRIVVVSVSGASMAPTLRSGDRLLVRRTPGEAVRAGEIVVVEETRPCRRGEPIRTRHTRWVVKRVVAVPGDPAPAFLPVWERGPDSRVPPRRPRRQRRVQSGFPALRFRAGRSGARRRPSPSRRRHAAHRACRPWRGCDTAAGGPWEWMTDRQRGLTR